jgi:hypothetical protein
MQKNEAVREAVLEKGILQKCEEISDAVSSSGGQGIDT